MDIRHVESSSSMPVTGWQLARQDALRRRKPFGSGVHIYLIISGLEQGLWTTLIFLLSQPSLSGAKFVRECALLQFVTRYAASTSSVALVSR